MKLTARQLQTLMNLAQENRACYPEWVGSTAAILNRLVGQGFVSVRRKRLSNIYTITDAGRAAVASHN